MASTDVDNLAGYRNHLDTPVLSAVLSCHMTPCHEHVPYPESSLAHTCGRCGGDRRKPVAAS